jgi:hypothetical protein
MYGAGAVVFAVWSYAIANKDEGGELELNPSLLAGMIGCRSEEVEEAIEYLASPDPGSRSEKEEGRRITQTGHRFMYRVVNHEEFMAIARREHLRLYNRQKKRDERERNRGGDVKGQSRGVKGSSGVPAHVDVDVDVASKKASPSSSSRKDDGAFVKKVLEYWAGNALQPRAVSVSKARRAAILARRREHSSEAVWTALKNRASSNFLNNIYNDGRGAPIDWVFGPKNFVKVVDGNFNEGPKGPRGKTNGTGTDYDSVLNR